MADESRDGIVGIRESVTLTRAEISPTDLEFTSLLQPQLSHYTITTSLTSRRYASSKIPLVWIDTPAN